MKFDVKNRFSGEVQFTAEIEADDDAPARIKMGLAVKWARQTGADLRGADLRGADLRGADLAGADLDGADLAGADLGGADLRGADLAGAALGGADLRGADLDGADLRGAYLAGADLRGADLRGAYLRGAYLAGADLGGADLVDAGQDARGYRFVGFLRDNKLRIVAGCRDFSLQEARARWKGRHADDPALKAECLAKVDLIAKVAKARGWKT